jgi:hypothetical protein
MYDPGRTETIEGKRRPIGPLNVGTGWMRERRRDQRQDDQGA